MAQKIHYVLVDALQGIPLSWSTSPQPKSAEGLRAELPFYIDPAKVFLRDGKWFYLPKKRPSYHHAFDPEKAEWIDQRPDEVIAREARAALDELVKEERSRRVSLGIQFNLKGYGQSIALRGKASDREYLNEKVTEAGLVARQGSGEATVSFVDAANEIHNLSPDQIIAVWSALRQWVDGVYLKGLELRQMDQIPDNFRDDQWWPAA